jgi:hypothetical protein
LVSRIYPRAMTFWQQKYRRIIQPCQHGGYAQVQCSELNASLITLLLVILSSALSPQHLRSQPPFVGQRKTYWKMRNQGGQRQRRNQNRETNASTTRRKGTVW